MKSFSHSQKNDKMKSSSDKTLLSDKKPFVKQPQVVPSVKQVVPSVKQVVPSVKQVVPSAKQVVPSVKQPVPSVKQVVPLAKQVVQPVQPVPNNAVKTTDPTKKQHPLFNKWNIYYNVPDGKNWNSHKLIMSDIETAEQCIECIELFPENVVKGATLFTMKNNISPEWETEDNRNGGDFSYKIPNKYVYSIWRHISYVLCGETLTKDKSHMTLVNGISISPKKSFCILKIWMKTCALQEPSIFIDIPNLDKEGCYFEEHRKKKNFGA